MRYNIYGKRFVDVVKQEGSGPTFGGKGGVKRSSLVDALDGLSLVRYGLVRCGVGRCGAVSVRASFFPPSLLSLCLSVYLALSLFRSLTPSLSFSLALPLSCFSLFFSRGSFGRFWMSATDWRTVNTDTTGRVRGLVGEALRCSRVFARRDRASGTFTAATAGTAAAASLALATQPLAPFEYHPHLEKKCLDFVCVFCFGVLQGLHAHYTYFYFCTIILKFIVEPC